MTNIRGNRHINKRDKNNFSNTEKVASYIRNFNKISKYNFTAKEPTLELSEKLLNLENIAEKVDNKSYKLQFLGYITYNGKSDEQILGYLIKNISEETIYIKTKCSEIELSQNHKTCILHNDLVLLLSEIEFNGLIENAELDIKDDVTNMLKIDGFYALMNAIIIKSNIIDRNDKTKIFNKYIGLGNISKDMNIEYLVNFHREQYKNKKNIESNKKKEKFIKYTAKEVRNGGRAKDRTNYKVNDRKSD